MTLAYSGLRYMDPTLELDAQILDPEIFHVIKIMTLALFRSA